MTSNFKNIFLDTQYFANPEEAKHVFDQIKHRFPDLYSENVDSSPPQNTACMQITIEQWQAWRTDLRANAAQEPPTTNVVIKSLRADQNCFYRNFIETITSGARKPLRSGTKKAFTVTGQGVFQRPNDKASNKHPTAPLKTPQYTEQQKQGFSKAQSASLATPDHACRVFGFDTSRESILVGALFDETDVLFTDRNYIYDGGTVNRPYDFNTLEAAADYHESKQPYTLFSKENLADFIVEIKKKKDQYNEVLVRLRWGNQNRSKIFIASDTLSSRLQAQEYARLLKKRLVEQGEVDETYTVPIVYYIPESPLHFKTYSPLEQSMDTIEANHIHRTPEERNAAYNAGHFQFLLALPRDAIKNALQEPHNGQPLLWTILEQGLGHIVQSLAEKLDRSFEEILFEFDLRTATAPQQVLYHLIAQDHDAIALKMIQQPSFAIRQLTCVELGQDNNDTLAHLAVRKKKRDILDSLFKKGARVNQATCDEHDSFLGKTTRKLAPVHTAAEIGDIESIIRLRAHGANLNQKTQTGDTPLSYAIMYEQIEFVQYLIKHGVSIHQKNSHGETAIFDAVRTGNADLVTLLIANGAVLTEPNPNSQTPLALAAAMGKIDIVKIIVEKNKGIFKKNKNPLADPLLLAGLTGYLTVVEYLVAKGAPITHLLAASQNDYKISNVAVRTYIKNIANNEKQLGQWQAQLQEILHIAVTPMAQAQAYMQDVTETPRQDDEKIRTLERTIVPYILECMLHEFNSDITQYALLNTEVAADLQRQTSSIEQAEKTTPQERLSMLSQTIKAFHDHLTEELANHGVNKISHLSYLPQFFQAPPQKIPLLAEIKLNINKLHALKTRPGGP